MTDQRNEIVVISLPALQGYISDAVIKAMQFIKNTQDETRVINKSEAGRMIGRHPSTISSMVDKGILEGTKDGRVLLKSVKEYLTNEHR